MSERKRSIAPLQSEDYVSVRQASIMMGVSTRSVYGYIEMGRIRGIRIGASIAVPVEDVQNYERSIIGRPRVRIPGWRRPTRGNEQYLTIIRLRLRQGQEERFEHFAEKMRQKQTHRIPGTVARYIAEDQDDPRNVRIMLVWRKLVMPDAEGRKREVQSLLDDLADLIEPDQVKTFECQTLLQAI
jgi:hypothetical protein